MPDILNLITKWWKQLALIVAGCVLVVGTILFLQPSQYLSEATAVAANPTLSDKSRIFSENIQYLYSSMGSSDELDLIVGTGQLDTVYRSLVTPVLADHYKIDKQGALGLYKAAEVLKKNTTVKKSEYGELKVSVWDTDKNTAAELANQIMDRLNQIHQELRNETNRLTLAGLEREKNKMTAGLDSMRNSTGDITSPRTQAMTDQLTKYEKLINEYQVMVDTKPAVLMVVDRARPELQPGKPKRLLILTGTAFLAFLFGLGVALILERRKTTTL